MAKNLKEKNTRLGAVGGQAVLEGVMMKSKKTYAIAVRKENGEIVTKKGEVKSIREKIKILKLPIIRGIVNLVESLLFSFKTLTDSAEMAGIEFEEEPSKFEKWLEKKFGKSIINVITAIGSVLGVVLALFLFMYLPSLFTKGVGFLFTNLLKINFSPFAFSLTEGIFKIIIFILYIYLTSLLNDIKRVYQYHGAEHKSIFCYESGEELNVENVKKQSRFHPRCGTSFLFVVMIISILIMTITTAALNEMGIDTEKTLLRTLIKLLLLPLTVGFSFEFIMYAGKHNNICTRFFSAPGLWMQRLTTREPDDEMIEVAIKSLKLALPEEFPEESSEETANEDAENNFKNNENTDCETGEIKE